MKIAPYVEKLNNSAQFKEFSKKYDNAFMIAGFFILDFESGQNMHQIDFYVPSNKKIAAFTLDKGVTMQMLKAMSQKVPEKLDMKAKTDLDALHGILQDEMKNRGMTEEIKKIIAILQNIGGKKVWNLNCVLSGMEILRAHVEDESRTVLKMEKASILDFIKKIPGAELSKLQNQNGMQPAQASQAMAVAAPGESKEEAEEAMSDEKAQLKINQLKRLEEALKKEKERFEKAEESRKKSAEEKPAKTAKAKKSK